MINRYFIAKIDRALDDARPLGGFTAWYVFRSHDLREYYETLIEMELDLRFPEPSTSTEIFTIALPKEKGRTDVGIPISQHRKADTMQKKTLRNRTLWGLTFAASLLLAVSVSLFWFVNPFSERLEPTFSDFQAIERTDVIPVPEPAIQVEERKPIERENNFFAGILSPNDFIVRFSEEPIEATVSLLEMARIVQRYELREEL